MITIHTPTSKLEESISFYKALYYQQVHATSPCLFSGANTLIEINPDRFARAGIKCYKKSWETEVEALVSNTKVYPIDKGYLLNDLNGCWIYLMEQDFPLPTIPAKNTAAITGNFAGLSLECADMERSVPIWETIGFRISQGSYSSGYMTLANEEGFNVSLMKPLTCPHLFFNPSLTFFNGKDNLKIIEQIREAKLPITEEITHFNQESIVDNIIIRDPGGYGFFIFND